jgi:hypothetical protein
LLHACSVAVVLPYDEATTVMTRVALPVLNRSGSAWPVAAARAGERGAATTGAAEAVLRGAAGAGRELLGAAADELGVVVVTARGGVTVDGAGSAELFDGTPGPARMGR